MNDLIEKLFSSFIKARFPLDSITKDDMRIIVESACQAQRNACLRRFSEHYPGITAKSKGTIGIISQNAEITEADYE